MIPSLVTCYKKRTCSYELRNKADNATLWPLKAWSKWPYPLQRAIASRLPEVEYALWLMTPALNK